MSTAYSKRSAVSVNYVNKLKTLKGGKFKLAEDYAGIYVEVKHRCLVHKVYFIERPFSLLHTKHKGCFKCNKEGNTRVLYKDKDIQKLLGNKYSLIKVNRKRDSQIELAITCKKHGDYLYKSNTISCLHTLSKGCPSCKQERTSKQVNVSSDYFKQKLVEKGKDVVSVATKDGKVTFVKIRCQEHGVYEYPKKESWFKYKCPICVSRKPGAMRNHTIEKNLFRVQGYESQAITWLLKNTKYRPNEIFVSSTRGVPTIIYKFNNEQFRYFPDMYIPSKNLIIEVKSIDTFCKSKSIYYRNKSKALAVVNKGYKFYCMVMVGKNNASPIYLPEEWVTWSHSKMLNYLEDPIVWLSSSTLQ